MNRGAWAIFLSGRGSNAQALFEISDEAPIGLVVSDKEAAPGLALARRAGLPRWVIPRLENRSLDWAKVHQRLIESRIERIFLLGFMRLIPADFLRPWRDKIWNLHPSLLPAYPGLHAIDKSYQEAAEMGVSVHKVIAEMDAGELVYQQSTLKDPQLCSRSEAGLLISRDEQKLVRRLFSSYGGAADVKSSC